MKKQEVTSLLFWLAAFGGYIAYFFLVVQPFFSKSPFPNDAWVGYFALFVCTILASAIFSAIMYELLHMLGAKMGGYKIVSVNILGFNVYLENGKRHFRFSKFDGLTGETKVIPVEGRKKESNPTAYIFLNSIFFVIEFAVLYFLYFYFKDNANKWLQYLSRVCLTFGLTALVIWLYNLLPLQMENKTDGYRFAISKGKEKRKEYNRQLISEYYGISNEVVEAQDNNEEKQPEEIAIDESSIEGAYSYIHLGNNEKALEIVEKLIDDPKHSKHTLSYRCLRFYIQTINLSLDEGKTIYDRDFNLEDRRNISGENNLPAIEAYVLMAGLYDKSHSECDRVLKKADRLYKKLPVNKRAVEKQLINNVINRVKDIHPNWNLEQYIVEE